DLPPEKKGQALFQLAQCIQSKAAIPALCGSLDGRTMRTMELRYGKDYFAELRSADMAKLEAKAIRLFTEVAEKYGNEKYGLKNLMEKEQITWRSWWDGGSTSGPIATQWNVSGWPTVYVIDHRGVIRSKHLSGTALEKLVDALVTEAQVVGDRK